MPAPSAHITIPYEPLEVFREFHASTAKYRALIGALGSGKSTAMYAECIAMALQQPGSNMLLARKYGPDIKDTTERALFELLPSEMVAAGKTSRGGGRVQDFEFANGSRIAFRGLDDWTRFKSTEFCFIGIDEADEQTSDSLDGISGRLRQAAPLRVAAERGYTTTMPMRHSIVLASNPAGKNWLWRRFINDETRPPGHAGWTSTSFDNPHLPRAYVEDLLSKDPAWVRRWVWCEFDEIIGAVYPHWGDHSIVHDFVPPANKSAEIWMGFDPGTSAVNPSAALWVVVDRAKGRLVALAEYTRADAPAAAIAEDWKRIERQLPGRVTYRVADPTAVATRDRGSNMTLSDIYRRLGYSFVGAASNKHIVRVPALGELIATQQFVATGACPTLDGQIRAYSREDQHRSQVDKGPFREGIKKGNDHLVDCAQYLAQRWVSRAPGARPPAPGPPDARSKRVRELIDKQLRLKNSRHDDGVIV